MKKNQQGWLPKCYKNLSEDEKIKKRNHANNKK